MKNTGISTLVCLMLVIMMAAALSCSQKKDDPVPVVTPFGSWIRTFTGSETYSAQLNLKSEGVIEWIMLDTLSTHTNSYSQIQVSGNQLRIFNDPDFTGDGIYKWGIENGPLTMALVNDSYPARTAAIAGTWQVKDETASKKVQGSWQKNMTADGLNYRVQLTLTSSGILNWTMIDIMPGHTNSSVSFTTTDSAFVLFKDPDCPGNGYYSYQVTDTSLIITLLKDHCPPRAPSFTGTWIKVQ
jgi:hypothetical protein